MQGDQAVRTQDLFWCLCDPAVIENGGTYDSRTRKQLKRADSLSTRKRKITFFYRTQDFFWCFDSHKIDFLMDLFWLSAVM